MNKLVLMTSVCLGLAACGDRQANTAGESAATSTNVTTQSTAAGNETASAATWPKGTRIVEERGVVYRVEPSGTRVQLGPTDSRIVVENDVRYRVDPNGTRVRIDPTGAAIDVDVPDVRVGINEKGNPDVHVVTNRR